MFFQSWQVCWWSALVIHSVCCHLAATRQYSSICRNSWRNCFNCCGSAPVSACRCGGTTLILTNFGVCPLPLCQTTVFSGSSTRFCCHSKKFSPLSFRAFHMSVASCFFLASAMVSAWLCKLAHPEKSFSSSGISGKCSTGNCVGLTHLCTVSSLSFMFSFNLKPRCPGKALSRTYSNGTLSHNYCCPRFRHC